MTITASLHAWARTRNVDAPASHRLDCRTTKPSQPRRWRRRRIMQQPSWEPIATAW